MVNIYHQKIPIKCDVFEVLKLFKEEPFLFCLESSQYDYTRGRYSFIGFDPFDVVKAKGPQSLQKVKEKFNAYYQKEPSIITPFYSGIAGFISYDYGLYKENILGRAEDDIKTDDVVFGFYDCIITIDHNLNEIIVASTGLGEKNEHKRSTRAQEKLKAVVSKLNSYFNGFICHEDVFNEVYDKPVSYTANMTKEEYIQAVRNALNYISNGSIYQVNLSQRFAVDAFQNDLDPLLIYQALRKFSPAPFSGYFDAGRAQVISSSPERFLQLKGSYVQTRPMKGTRPRGRNREKDEQLRHELIASAKDQAELLMITDLERNDLGKVCEFGSIVVREPRTIEEYKTVFQATSTIEGILKKEYDAFDLIEACFPGGSITGCPKIRSMQIIEELEPTKRSVYTGCLGYIGFDGAIDFNILIRTLLKVNRKIYFQVGSGIVADSSPEDEYAETMVKAQAMMDALACARLKQAALK